MRVLIGYIIGYLLAFMMYIEHIYRALGLLFNKQDGLIDRVSKVAPYAIVDGLPRNPMGRTGFAGRGALGRWGVNHQTHVAITR